MLTLNRFNVDVKIEIHHFIMIFNVLFNGISFAYYLICLYSKHFLRNLINYCLLSVDS